MKILVTGASGFIGYKLASDLADSGHEVVALCNKNSAPRGCTSIIADLADRVPDIPNGKISHTICRGCDAGLIYMLFTIPYGRR